MKLWLKATWNVIVDIFCLCLGGAIFIFAFLAVTLLLGKGCGIAIAQVCQILGPYVCAAIAAWWDKAWPWILGVIGAASLIFMFWVIIKDERDKLARMEEEMNDDETE